MAKKKNVKISSRNFEKYIEEITIKEGVTEIGWDMFDGYTSLKKITLIHGSNQNIWVKETMLTR